MANCSDDHTTVIPVEGYHTSVFPAERYHTSVFPADEGYHTSVFPVEGYHTTVFPVEGYHTTVFPVEGYHTTVFPVTGIARVPCELLKRTSWNGNVRCGSGVLMTTYGNLIFRVVSTDHCPATVCIIGFRHSQSQLWHQLRLR
jgi:hypothetical protein